MAIINIGSSAGGGLSQEDINRITEAIDGKQDVLTAGDNISIDDNEISAVVPEAIKNPYALTFGNESYDGSVSANITLQKLGGVDSDFVNSSIMTNTAFFRGTFTTEDALFAYNGTATNNDYAFVEVTQGDTVLRYDRYKYVVGEYVEGYMEEGLIGGNIYEDATLETIIPIEKYKIYLDLNTGNKYKATPLNWLNPNQNLYLTLYDKDGIFVYEYTLNNSSFTSDQWKAINSGIDSIAVLNIERAIGDMYNLGAEVANKQDTLTAGDGIEITNEDEIRCIYGDEETVISYGTPVFSGILYGNGASNISGTPFYYGVAINNTTLTNEDSLKIVTDRTYSDLAIIKVSDLTDEYQNGFITFSDMLEATIDYVVFINCYGLDVTNQCFVKNSDGDCQNEPAYVIGIGNVPGLNSSFLFLTNEDYLAYVEGENGHEAGTCSIYKGSSTIAYKKLPNTAIEFGGVSLGETKPVAGNDIFNAINNRHYIINGTYANDNIYSLKHNNVAIGYQEIKNQIDIGANVQVVIPYESGLNLIFDYSSNNTQSGTYKLHFHSFYNDGESNYSKIYQGIISNTNGQAAMTVTELPIVNSVNGQSGAVSLTAADVGALPNDTVIPTVPVQSVNGQTGAVSLGFDDIATGTISAPLTVNGGDGENATGSVGKIIFVPDANNGGQITDTGTGTIFGFVNATDLAVGHKSYNLKLRGKQTRPTYDNGSGGKELALKSDVPEAQQQTNWNATSGIASIANKPSNIVLGYSDTASTPSALKIVTCTQAEYDLSSKSADTIYLIVG